MKRCTYPGCGGRVFVEPAEDTLKNPFGEPQKKTEERCILCGREDGAAETPLPLVANRFLSAGGR